jgi:hypothetical protein
MAGVLDCPAQAINPPADSISEACRKLATCNILADTHMHESGTACSSSEECNREGRGPGGECLTNEKGESRCYYHNLDYFWCVLRFTQLDNDPCDGNVRFTVDNVQAAIGCIAVTGCSALGASFPEKQQRQNGKVADNDKYVCKNGTTTIWTATICDGGLLEYASHTPSP